MKYHISIHISPYEIDNYQLFIHQLRRNLNYINDKEIIFNPCLNLSDYFYDWNNSTLKSDFFVYKFNELNKIIENQVVLDSIINFDKEILGALSYKRNFIKKYKNQVDAFIWFDSDMIFPDDLLFYLTSSFESANQEYCIITPQITKLWDNTWDVIVNEKYINQFPNHDTYFNFDGYDLYNNHPEDKNLIENIHPTKFASGWGNLLSSGIFKKYIEFTEDLGHYGIDDTFIMYTVDIHKKNKQNIKQFILQNIVVVENNKFKISSYDDLIFKNKNIKLKEDFRQESEQGMLKQLNKIKNEIQRSI